MYSSFTCHSYLIIWFYQTSNIFFLYWFVLFNFSYHYRFKKRMKQWAGSFIDFPFKPSTVGPFCDDWLGFFQFLNGGDKLTPSSYQNWWLAVWMLNDGNGNYPKHSFFSIYIWHLTNNCLFETDVTLTLN